MITPEQAAEAKKNGQAVLYSAPGKPVRILSKEETKKLDDNWDNEYCCPKKLAELYRKVQERTRGMMLHEKPDVRVELTTVLLQIVTHC
ncbi:MAG: hypothetical protein II295_04170 [Akkermansia sp.]|nr:hypothetical protein [Akkermansia sp.]